MWKKQKLHEQTHILFGVYLEYRIKLTCIFFSSKLQLPDLNPSTEILIFQHILIVHNFSSTN